MCRRDGVKARLSAALGSEYTRHVDVCKTMALPSYRVRNIVLPWRLRDAFRVELCLQNLTTSLLCWALTNFYAIVHGQKVNSSFYIISGGLQSERLPAAFSTRSATFNLAQHSLDRALWPGSRYEMLQSF